MSKVSVSSVFSAKPDAAWGIIGEPGEISSWHPAISTSTRDGKRRTCTMADGAKLQETILEHDDSNRAYRYQVDESPLPMRDYVSTIRVDSDAAGCKVTWESEFEAQGMPAAELENMIRGLYQAGLDNLGAMLTSAK